MLAAGCAGGSGLNHARPVAVKAAYTAHASSTVQSAPTAVVGGGSEFPLQVSSNDRYLEDASGSPWLMVGDSPWTIIGNASETNADAYFADREEHGFDAALMSALCDSYIECTNSDGTTYDGIKPFTTGSSPSNYDLTTPNSTYWDRLHDMVADAAKDNIEVFLVPIDTGGCDNTSWFPALVSNGDGTVSTTDSDYRYGQFLGNEFKDLDNVTWLSGNDFQCIETTADNNDALSVANGIANTDPAALQTAESDTCDKGGLTCTGSSSFVDTKGVSTGWGSHLQLNGSYTYSPAYAEDRLARAQTPTAPMFLEEMSYEGVANSTVDPCDTNDPVVCRQGMWWTMTSGATGLIYGGPCFPFSNSTDLSDCDTRGAAELKTLEDFLSSVDWEDLVPDTSHSLVTSGYGSCPTVGSTIGVSCVTDAETPDQTLALAYDPQGNTITVDLSQMAGSTTARWLDPADGDFTSISGSPFPNSGSQSFISPGTNSAGDHDWVLVLQAPKRWVRPPASSPRRASGGTARRPRSPVRASASAGSQRRRSASGN
jgi:Protein of unknown function (DUF4038)/Putative collagen-binding domain of a collagenase